MRNPGQSRFLPWVLLGLLMLGSGAILLSVTSGINFVTDEWNLLFLRSGWTPDSFLEPFHEHVIIAPTLIYKVLQGTLGMDSNRPFQLAALIMFLAIGPLLFIWMRRRIGDWAALIGVALILFLGAAFEDLLWAFQIGYFGSLAFGLAALIALDRDDRRGDVAAAILLVLSLSFSSLGLPFVAGAAAEWLTNPRERGKRWLVPAAAAAFYGIWWLGWGHSAETTFSLANIPEAPRFILDAASAGATSLFGLATGDGSEPDQPHLIWGRIILVALLALSGLRLWRLKRIPPGVIIAATVALSFFALSALAQSESRLPTSSRYQLPGALFLLLFFTEILRGLKLKPPALVAGAAVTIAAAVMGVGLMSEQSRDRWVPVSTSTSTYLGMVAYAGEANDPELVLNLGPGSEVPIDRFLDQVKTSGSPGYSAGEIQSRDAGVRAAADQDLIELTKPLLSGFNPGGNFDRCREYPPDVTVAVRSGVRVIEIRSLGDQILNLGLARFGDPPGYPIGSTHAGSMGWLEIPAIDDPPPWQVTGDGPFAVCYR